MEIICINDNFSEEWLKWALEHNVKHPIENKIYSIREITKHSNGKTGLLLNEINNPKVPQMGGVFELEPSFDINRFRNLDKTKIKDAEFNTNKDYAR